MGDTTDTSPATWLWPDASSLPRADAPPLEWARFYRDRCGWIVLPTPGYPDILKITEREFAEVLADYRADHGGDPDEDTRQELYEITANSPAIRKRFKGVCGFVKSSDFARPAQVTDEHLRRWWGTKDGRERGIAVVVGAAKSWAHEGPWYPVVLVEVDCHGPEEDGGWGDLEGPWGRGGDLGGPRSTTPGGGLHTLVLSAGDEVSSGGRTALAVGVEVKARGSSPVRVPSGASSPSRRWERWEEPRIGPAALRQRMAPARDVGGRDDADAARDREREPGDDDEAIPSGRAAAALRDDAVDGQRHDAVHAIVGVLARPGACPDDVVAAALALLSDDLGGPREREGTPARIREEAARWRHALTRGPRDADFAAEVLACWCRVRDTGRPRWTEAMAERIARSLWKTIDRREGGEAGAEDYGVGPMLAPAAAEVGALPYRIWPTVHVAEDMAEGAPAAPVPFPPPPPEVAAAAVAASSLAPPPPRWRGGIDPRTYVRTLGDFYGDDKLERDLQRAPIRVDAIVPAVDFLTGRPSSSPNLLTPPLMMGWGGPLGETLGGLSPGDLWMIGAGSAGAGKTQIELWLAYGLAIATACRLLGAPGYERAPVVLPVIVTEMPKDNEPYFRAASAYLGFDRACLSAGTQAHDAKGVRAQAAALGMTPLEVVDRARKLERLHGADPRFPLCAARYRVLRVVDLQKLPRRGRVNGVAVDHRAGPDLIDHLADAVDVFREDLAREASIAASDVLPLVVIDPGQRFIADGESEKRAIDALFNAIDSVLCKSLGCAVIGTSDTTKAAAREATDLGTFLSKNGSALAADIFAGSQAIIHHANCIALCHEPPPPGASRTKMYTRVLKDRNGGIPGESHPFDWEMALGRFRPLPPEPLRAPPPSDGAGQRRQSPAPAPANTAPLASAAAGLRLPPVRRDRADAIPD